MGQEGERGEYGLCNAVLLSKPRSRFAVRWIALFNEVFDARIWSMHSVKYPLFAAALWPSDITVSSVFVRDDLCELILLGRCLEGRRSLGHSGTNFSICSKVKVRNGPKTSGCICGKAFLGTSI